MDFNNWKEDITTEFLEQHGINSTLFFEIADALIPSLKINSFKLTSDMTKEDFLNKIFNLPYSNKIIQNLKISLDLNISDDELEELRKALSLYMFFHSVIHVKKTYLNPILKLIYNRQGKLRMTGPFTLFMKNKLEDKNENIDIEALSFSNQLDQLLRSNLDTLEYGANKDSGRPSNALEDHLIGEFRTILEKKRKYFHSELLQIIHFLKTNYHNIFSELPYSGEAVKKSLQKKINLFDASDQT